MYSFSIGFIDLGYDEVLLVRELVVYLGCDYIELYVSGVDVLVVVL